MANRHSPQTLFPIRIKQLRLQWHGYCITAAQTFIASANKGDKMKKALIIGLAFGLVVASAPLTVSATTITVEKTGNPLRLLHSEVYMWGVQSSTWDTLTKPITSASITLTQIWDNNASGYNNDQLALFLLDDAYLKSTLSVWRTLADCSIIAPTGFANSLVKADFTNNLFSEITPLITYYVTEDISNSSSHKVDLTYNFTSANLTTLQTYLTDATPGSYYRDIALGLDPDCHFQLDKITFSVSDDVTSVPEPATMLLMGSGLAGLIGAARRKKRA